MTKPTYTEAPYDREGNLCHHHTDGQYYVPDPDAPGRTTLAGPEWLPIVPFSATLNYDGYGRGRSAAYLYWRATATQIRYPMFMTDLDAILQAGVMLPGRGLSARLAGQFTIIKRGQNYGITRVGPRLRTPLQGSGYTPAQLIGHVA